MNTYKGILVIFHCRENTGYAIKTLEERFYEVGKLLVGNNIHFSYTEISNTTECTQPSKNISVIKFDPTTSDKNELQKISQYVHENNIECVLGFDQPPGRKYYKYIRKAGVKHIVSYWGASMSDINSGLKLGLKRIEMLFHRYSPDHYIFESNAMRDTAIYGRGISKRKTSITYLGVDTNKYKPNSKPTQYPYTSFSIPKDRKIIFYSGHMEPRKGVRVLINAAIELVDRRDIKEFHFLILGNKNGEESLFEEMLISKKAKDHVTFGGYRDDISEILPECYLGVIASTGWDSFTMSALEMASAGLPMLVSDLQGLRETISNGNTGFLFEAGNHEELADKITKLIFDNNLRNKMSEKSRKRVSTNFTISKQIDSLTNTIKALNK